MITLKEAIKEFPANAEKLISKQIPDNFSKLDYRHKYKCVGKLDIIAVISVKDSELFFGIKEITVRQCGKNIFKKVEWKDTVVIKDNKVKSNIKCSDNLIHFFEFINRPIVHDLNKKEFFVVTKAYMIKAILCNKVYSIETFYKELMLRSYHLKGFDWKLFRKAYCQLYISILDLIVFTKNLHDTFERLLSDVGDTEHAILYSDLLTSAKNLGEVVDFKWSINRMREEHKRQIETLLNEEINEKEVVPIFDLTDVHIETPCIKLLNTERDIFLEGKNMHHCLYSNYFRRIKNHDYIAFHMTTPEDCTFSFKRNAEGVIFLDQIYLSYDRHVKDETKKVALTFLNTFYNDIAKLLDKKVNLEDLLFGSDI